MEKKIDINIMKLCSLLWADKRRACIVAAVMSVVGIVVAFSTVKFYKSSVLLAPEEMSSGAMGNISSLASMVGLDMKIGTSDAIYPELYPELIGSTDFLVGMFDVKVKTKDGALQCDYYTYLDKHQKHAWWEAPMIGVKKLIASLKKGNGAQGGAVNPFQLTERQDAVAKAIYHNIQCLVDKKTNMINITVTDQDPLVAATIADSVRAKLQLFITDYRTKKARNDVAYMQQLFDEAHQQYVKARQQYVSFSDSNQEALLQSVRSKQEDLENEMQLKYNIYTQLAEQLQLAQAKVLEKTPAFTTIQRATVPVKHSNKPKILILLIFLVLGFIGEVIYIICKNRGDFIVKTTEK